MEELPWYRVVAPLAACAAFLVLVAVRPLPRFRFAALGLVGMVGYGMLQDQVSARLCPEYFTVYHPAVPGLTDPTLLGIAWGFLGGWWGEFLMGYSAGLAATLGERPPLAPREFVRPLALLLLAVAAVTALTGFTVWRHVEMLGVSVPAPGVAPGNQRWLLIVACAHFATYATAVVGSVVLCVWVARERKRAAVLRGGPR